MTRDNGIPYSNVLFATKAVGVYPQIIVSLESRDTIKIAFYPTKGEGGHGVIVTRRDARLLERRINAALRLKLPRNRSR